MILDTEHLSEINKCELISDDGWKYVISTYEDVTEVEYYESATTGKPEYVLREKFSIPSMYDIQVCQKIIELRKAYRN